MYSDILHILPKREQHPDVQDDMPPPIPANVQDDDIPPLILANVQDDDIPPPLPNKTNKTSDTTKQTSNDEEITGRLTSFLASTSEVKTILEASLSITQVIIKSMKQNNTLSFILAWK